MVYNLLTDRLPAEISVCGHRCPIYTDFRRWILVIELFAEEDLPAAGKLECAAKLVFPGWESAGFGKNEEFFRSLANGIVWFASCGHPVRRTGRGLPVSGRDVSAEPVLDFTQDAERIAAGFLQTYGIDLCSPSVTMHFWKFMALLRNLPAETEFMRVVNLRKTDTTAIEDDTLRRRIRRAKANVRIRGGDDDRKERYYG